MFLRILAAVTTILCLTACTAPEPEAPSLAGAWRMEFTVPGGMLPVGLEISGAGETLSAALINGEEQVRVPRVVQRGPELELVFPAFNNRLDAVRDGDALRGTLTLVKRGGVRQEIPFRARRGFDYRFVPAQAQAEVDVSGRWAVTFTDDEGTKTPAVGEFRQEGNRLQGTFLTETGDYRFLAGEVTGRQMLLSAFDGAHLFLFAATVEDDGSLKGDFWSGNAWHETWTGRRDQDASLSDAYGRTFLKSGYERLAFTFPDTAGNPVSLSDPRFAGKVVLVTLAGTWCPNCHDEARFLAPFYRRYRDQGLEVIALLYEHFEDFETASVQAEKFRQELGIDYTLLVAGYSDKQRAAETLPMLNRVLAFPTTIFIARDGSVRKIHTGFTGPGTGMHFDSFRKEFEAYVRALLDERA